jgi:hypothetical protein
MKSEPTRKRRSRTHQISCDAEFFHKLLPFHGICRQQLSKILRTHLRSTRDALYLLDDHFLFPFHFPAQMLCTGKRLLCFILIGIAPIHHTRGGGKSTAPGESTEWWRHFSYGFTEYLQSVRNVRSANSSELRLTIEIHLLKSNSQLPLKNKEYQLHLTPS